MNALISPWRLVRLLGPCLLTGMCFSQAASPPPALIARLETPLDSRKLKVGSEFLASAQRSWHGVDCSLKKGAIVYGRVTEIIPPVKGSGPTAKVQFDRADCNGLHAAAFRFLLAGLVVPPEKIEYDVLQAEAGLFENGTAVGGMGNGALTVAGGGLTTQGTAVLGGGMAGAGAAHRPTVGTGLSTDAVGQNQGLGMQVITPLVTSAGYGDGTAGLHLDEVRNVSGMVLHSQPGAGTTEIFSKKKDFQLGPRTQMVMLALPPEDAGAKHLQPRATEASSPPSAPAVIPTVVIPPVDQTEVCAEGCSSMDVAATTSSTGSVKPDAALGLTNLGYRPRTLGLRSSFDRETTVTFLSAHQLLLTFDLHKLRERTGEAWRAGTRRMIRAVLVNVETHAIERVVDWQVEGAGEYLWQAGSGHILLRSGGALRLIGPELREEASFPVHGDLLWVTSSPSGSRIAYGEVNERHDKTTHTMLAEQSGKQPEEDVEMHLVDASGTTLMHRTGTSAMRAPVLMEEGEATVRRTGPAHWQIVERSPEGTIVRALTEVNSHCSPLLAALAHDLVSIRGCTARSQRWFRVIRNDGRTLLTDPPTMDEIEQNAASGGSAALAVSAIKLNQPTGLNDVILAGQMRHERIEVHRLSDGRPMLAVVTTDFPASRRAYALSPDDAQLAVMTQSQVQFYRVEAPK